MSRHCWEHGEITLPTAVVAPLKRTLREAANKHHTEVLNLCRHVWVNELRCTRSTKLYAQRLTLWRERLTQVHANFYDFTRMSQIQQDASMILDDILWNAQHNNKTLHQATSGDVQKWAPKYTNRDRTFRLGEASISFNNNNTVIWDVPENNHADEQAHKHPLALIFFNYLNYRIRWTRGTGGQIIGNDEYNQDSDEVGGGGNYLVEQWPKVGRSSYRFTRLVPSRPL